MQRNRANESLSKECGWKGGDSGGSDRNKERDNQRPKRIDLTPTGLLMEGHFTHRELPTPVN